MNSSLVMFNKVMSAGVAALALVACSGGQPPSSSIPPVQPSPSVQASVSPTPEPTAQAAQPNDPVATYFRVTEIKSPDSVKEGTTLNFEVHYVGAECSPDLSHADGPLTETSVVVTFWAKTFAKVDMSKCTSPGVYQGSYVAPKGIKEIIIQPGGEDSPVPSIKKTIIVTR